MAIEIEIKHNLQVKRYAPHSDHNVISINPIAVKVVVTCQPSDASVNRMVDCVSIRVEKITFAARINVVLMDDVRVLPRVNLVRLVVPFVVVV